MQFITRPRFNPGSPVRALLLLLAGLQVAFAEQRLDVPYVPTPHAVVDRMLQMAEPAPADKLIDLGSGDGRIVIAAVRDWGVSDAEGIDLDAQRIAEARRNARDAGVEDRAGFEQGDLFEKDFTDADILTLYLLKGVNLRLRPILLSKMKPGTRIVSHAFDMGDWQADRYDKVASSSIYLWIVPAPVAGRWQFVAGDGGDFTLSLTQHYQKIEGGATINGDRKALSDPRLRGTEISFSIGDKRYVGQVDGDRIEGTAPQDWHARRL